MAKLNNLGIKTYNEMVAASLNYITSKNIGLSNINPNSVLRTLIEAVLQDNDTANYYLNYVYNALSIDNATGEDLDRLIEILGVIRNSATNAVGTVTFSTGDAPAVYDIYIPNGYIVSTRPDVSGKVTEFKVINTTVLHSGETSINVDVKCTTTGEIFIPVGALSVMTTSIVGVVNVVNGDEISGGSNAETDDELRIRTKGVSTAFGKCTENALESAVNNIDGVVGCNVIDQARGLGTFDIIVATQIIPPTDQIKADINKVVADTKGAGISASVIYPTVVTGNINVNVIVATPSIYPMLYETIYEFATSLTVGQSFVIKQLERKILNVLDTNVGNADDVDITTLSPTANVVISSTQVFRPGTITINGTVVTG